MYDRLTIIREMWESDLPAVSEIHREAFPRQLESEAWVQGMYASKPVSLGFVAASDQIDGFVFWRQISGIRQRSVIELDQLAVREASRGQNIGRILVSESFGMMQEMILERGSELGAVIVKTGQSNHAQALYRSELGVEPLATIDNLFAQPEVILVRTF